MRRSQASAIESPAPAAAPSTCATTGFGISCKIRETSMPRRRFAILASNANGARPSAIDLTSPPTQNVPPAPFRRTARTSWSSAARRAASTRPRVMSGLSALRRSGRFMVMVSSPESSFCRTISLLMRCCLCWYWLAPVIPGWSPAPDPESRDSGFDVEPVIGRAFARPVGIAPE